MTHFISKTSFLLCLPFSLSAATMRQWDPQPYFSEEDSPFIHGIRNGDIYLEDFEDQKLNTPFVVVPELGYIGQSYRASNRDVSLGRVWSVDGDDGIVDGNGYSGDSWIGINQSSFTISNRMQFNFLPDDQGRYPSYVGIVVTGFDNANDDISMVVHDQNGDLLEFEAEFDPRDWIPSGAVQGGDPRIHRFVGFYNEGGISDFIIDEIYQLDHLQYGYAIPEPSTSLLGFLALPLLWQRRRSPAL